jgi:hypothetical protein
MTTTGPESLKKKDFSEECKVGVFQIKILSILIKNRIYLLIKLIIISSSNRMYMLFYSGSNQRDVVPGRDGPRGYSVAAASV